MYSTLNSIAFLEQMLAAALNVSLEDRNNSTEVTEREALEEIETILRTTYQTLLTVRPSLEKLLGDDLPAPYRLC